MKPALQVGHYTQPEIFEQEQDRLFGRLWIFACLSTAIAAKNAFATRRIRRRPVLIQNSGGPYSRVRECLIPHPKPYADEYFRVARCIATGTFWEGSARSGACMIGPGYTFERKAQP